MILLERSNVTDLMALIPAVKKDLKCWGFLDIALTAGSNHNVMSIARKIEKALGAREGAIFVHDKGHVLSFVKHSLFAEDCLETICAAVVKCLPEYSCDVVSSGMTVEGLRNIEIRLSKAADNEGPYSSRSIMYQHRVERRENVIMLVDRDQHLVRILQVSLEQFGKCVTVHDPGLLLDTYLDYVPDIVFLDIDLRPHSGLEILDLLTKYDKDAYVVMLTRARTADSVLAAKAKGAKSFVGKPFELTRLTAEIRACPTIKQNVV